MNRDDVPFSMFGHLPKEAEESGQNEIARLRADLAAMTAELARTTVDHDNLSDALADMTQSRDAWHRRAEAAENMVYELIGRNKECTFCRNGQCVYRNGTQSCKPVWIGLPGPWRGPTDSGAEGKE